MTEMRCMCITSQQDEEKKDWIQICNSITELNKCRKRLSFNELLIKYIKVKRELDAQKHRFSRRFSYSFQNNNDLCVSECHFAHSSPFIFD